MPILGTVHASATIFCLGMSLAFLAAGCTSPSTRVGSPAETMPSAEQYNLNLVTEFALRKTILGMTRQSVEREIGVGELSTGGDFFYPMLYDAFLVVRYEDDRAAEMSINGSVIWDYRQP